MSLVSDQLIPWQEKFGRNNLPWQSTKNPYPIWISEIMLQQTQVKTVLPYYRKFMMAFPNVKVLAEADEDSVMQLWSGLGYYARARNLHETAKIIIKQFNGEFPSQLMDLLLLPGIGRSSAGAICSFAYNQKTPILDANVKRVFARFYGIKDWTGILAVEKKLWNLAEMNLPENKSGIYNQALMDLGAILCVKKEPQCFKCPISKTCKSYLNKWTDIIPAIKPKKEKPIQKSYFYIFRCKEKILFIKKPKKGIWGGLWSFPEFKEKLDINQWIKNELNSKSFKLLGDGIMLSTFTHYKIEMHYQYLKLKEPKNKVNLINGVWHEIDQIDKGAYPAPIKKIVKKLLQDRVI